MCCSQRDVPIRSQPGRLHRLTEKCLSRAVWDRSEAQPRHCWVQLIPDWCLILGAGGTGDGKSLQAPHVLHSPHRQPFAALAQDCKDSFLHPLVEQSLAVELCERSQYSHRHLFPWNRCNSVGLCTDFSCSRKRAKGRGDWQLERGTNLKRQEFSWLRRCWADVSNRVYTLGRKCGLSLALHPKNGHASKRNLGFGLWEWDTNGMKRNRSRSERIIWKERPRSEEQGKEGQSVPGTAEGSQGSCARVRPFF